MTDTYDFTPEVLKIIMTGLKSETRLNENGTQETYMVPKDNASEEQIKQAADALKLVVETSLDMKKETYTNGVSAIETLNRMGQPTMYRGADLAAMDVIEDIADAIEHEQTKQDMDIIRSVYTPVIEGDNVYFQMKERYLVNRENIEQAVKLLDHHFGVKINDPQEKVPLMAKAFRHTILNVPDDMTKHVIQVMQMNEEPAENEDKQPVISAEMERELNEAYETMQQQKQADEHSVEAEETQPTISEEMEKELNNAYEEMQAQKAEWTKQVAKAYEVSSTEREGTYFRPKEGVTTEELATGEQALRQLTEDKLHDKRLPNMNVIVPMGAMNGPKMFRAIGKDGADIFAEIAEAVKAVEIPQVQPEKNSATKTEEIDTPKFATVISEQVEADPIVRQAVSQENGTKAPATAEEKAIKYALTAAANLEKNFVVVAGNLEARPWVLPEQIEDIKKQVAPLLETKDIVKDGRVIGLEPTNPNQADVMFQMMEAAKATRGVLDTYPEMANNPQDVLKLYADNLETIQKAAKQQKTDEANTETPDNTVEPQTPQPAEEMINGTIVDRTVSPQLLADLKAEPAQEELSYIPPARMAQMYTELSAAEPTPETERKKEAIGKRMDKFIADYVAGEIVVNQDNIADTYDDMKKVLDLYGPEDKNASVARERLEKEIALYDKNNHLEDITAADETYLTNRLATVKEALNGVELDTYYTNLRFFDNDKKEVPQLNENGEVRSDSELAKLLNIVKSDILTEQTLAMGPVDSANVAKRANELLQVNTVALMAADLKRTGKDPTTAPERFEALKNGQTFMMPQGTMAGFTATNVNKQVALLNRLGTKLNNKSGVVQQLYEPIKTVDPLSKERFGQQPQKPNLLKTCLKKFALGSIPGALASGAGLGAMALALPTAPVVAGVMAAYTAGHMWVQRKREVEQAKKEGKEPSSLKNFFKKNTVRALLTGASLGAIAMGLPAVALGIGAAAAAVGFKGIFKRNRQEGYDVKTSILRSVPESVAGIAGAMTTGGLIYGTAMPDTIGVEQPITESAEATATDTVQPVVETVQSAPTNPDTAPAGTDTGADTGTTGTETTDGSDTGTPSAPVEETIQPEEAAEQTTPASLTVEDVVQSADTQEPVLEQPITLTELNPETPAFDLTNDGAITLSGQEMSTDGVDLNSDKPITITEDMAREALANQETPTVDQPTVGKSNITPEQREALPDDDLAEELNVIDRIEALAREQGTPLPPYFLDNGLPNLAYDEAINAFLAKPGNEALAAEYEDYLSYNPLFPAENVQDPSAIAANEPTVEVDPDTGTTYVHMEAARYASGHEAQVNNLTPVQETYEEAVPMSETSENPAITYGIGTNKTVDYDVQVQTVVMENTPVHHTYEASAHELAQARLNGEGLYDAAGRPTAPDYTQPQLEGALNQIRALEGTHPELTGANGLSNADILMYKLTQFNKLVAGSSELDINGTHIEINKAYGVQLEGGKVYTPAQLQADLLAGNTLPISADQTAEMLGKVELSISSKGHFNQDIAHFQESGKWSYKPGMEAGFTVEPVAQDGPTIEYQSDEPTVDLSQISMPEIDIPEIPIDINIEPQPVELGEIDVPDLSEGLSPAEEINPFDEIGLDGTIEETPVDKTNQEEVIKDDDKPFVPFTPYEKNEEKDKEQGENSTPQTPVAENATVETPVAETPAVGGATVERPAVGGATIETPAVENATVETPAVGGATVETPMGAHFSFGDATQTSPMADSGFAIPNSTDNVFTFDMSKPKEKAHPTPEDLQQKRQDLLAQLAQLDKQMADMGIDLSPVAEQTPQPPVPNAQETATNEAIIPQGQEEVATPPVVPPMQEETAEMPQAPVLTDSEQKAVEAIVNPSATPKGIEAEIKQDMLKAAGVETAPKKSIRETLFGMAKLNLIKSSGDKTTTNTLKKEPEAKQPFYKALFNKKGQGK